jgi:hypothetical protein
MSPPDNTAVRTALCRALHVQGHRRTCSKMKFAVT